MTIKPNSLLLPQKWWQARTAGHAVARSVEASFLLDVIHRFILFFGVHAFAKLKMLNFSSRKSFEPTAGDEAGQDGEGVGFCIN